MHLARSRIIAFGAVAAGVLVVLGAVVVAPERLRERWHLARLESDAPDDSSSAGFGRGVPTALW